MQYYKPAFKFVKPVIKLPKIITTFFLKLFLLVTTWELSYYFILKPARLPDKILTDCITSGVTACINFFFKYSLHAYWLADAVQPANSIYRNGRSVFFIHDECNGLNLIAIYLGFIILLPYSLKRKITFGLGGIVALTIGNIIRCLLLYWIYINYRSSFEFNHHYVFSVLMYLLIFCGWILFTQKAKLHEAG